MVSFRELVYIHIRVGLFFSLFSLRPWGLKRWIEMHLGTLSLHNKVLSENKRYDDSTLTQVSALAG